MLFNFVSVSLVDAVSTLGAVVSHRPGLGARPRPYMACVGVCEGAAGLMLLFGPKKYRRCSCIGKIYKSTFHTVAQNLFISEQKVLFQVISSGNRRHGSQSTKYKLLHNPSRSGLMLSFQLDL